MNLKLLNRLKKEYLELCTKEQATMTYRAFLNWLKSKGLEIDYFEGLDLKLLDFCNEVFDEIEGDKDEKE